MHTEIIDLFLDQLVIFYFPLHSFISLVAATLHIFFEPINQLTERSDCSLGSIILKKATFDYEFDYLIKMECSSFQQSTLGGKWLFNKRVGFVPTAILFPSMSICLNFLVSLCPPCNNNNLIVQNREQYGSSP